MARTFFCLLFAELGKLKNLIGKISKRLKSLSYFSFPVNNRKLFCVNIYLTRFRIESGDVHLQVKSFPYVMEVLILIIDTF